MPRTPMCSVFDINHCKFPVGERSVSHLHRYHFDKPAHFISHYNGKQITVYRDPRRGNYYPCPHHDCDHISILFSDPLSHHRSCPHFKLQYQHEELLLKFFTPSSAAPSAIAAASTSAVQQVVNVPPYVKRRRVARNNTGTDGPAKQETQKDPSRQSSPDLSDMSADFRSMVTAMASLLGRVSIMVEGMTELKSKLAALETAITAFVAIYQANIRSEATEATEMDMDKDLDDIIITLQDSIAKAKAESNNIDTVAMVRHAQDDHKKTLHNVTEAVQIVTASNQ